MNSQEVLARIRSLVDNYVPEDRDRPGAHQWEMAYTLLCYRIRDALDSLEDDGQGGAT